MFGINCKISTYHNFSNDCKLQFQAEAKKEKYLDSKYLLC